MGKSRAAAPAQQKVMKIECARDTVKSEQTASLKNSEYDKIRAVHTHHLSEEACGKDDLDSCGMSHDLSLPHGTGSV